MSGVGGVTNANRYDDREIDDLKDNVMILGNLNGLPQGHADQQRARFSKDALEGGFTQRMTQLGGADNVLMGIMQLHCDQGMNAARAMYDAKQTPGELLASHPDVARKYERDPAFHHGFNGVVFAHDNARYAEVVKALDARDARYEAHHVAWRA